MINARLANRQDFAGVKSLVNKLNEFRESNFSKMNLAFHKQKNESKSLSPKAFQKNIYIVAECNGILVGYICGSVYQLDRLYSKRGFIEELYVEEEFRQKALARKLLMKLQKEFKKRGCSIVTTLTDEENIAAQKFYQKNGMKRATIEYWKKI